MKAFLLACCLLALVPLQAGALSLSDDLLPAIAMPLAVSAVADVPGVQTDRLGQLVTYMDEANVPPADFVDVLRYVPVALVLRADNQPDFVEWTHQQILNGVTGPELVTVMERQLRTYDNALPVVTRTRSTNDAFTDDYVPVAIREHTDRLLLEPLSLIEMPLAVTDVYDMNGVPVDRVSDLVAQLNAANVPPVQFVEVMRYAPVAVVQPDFVPFVQTQVASGITGDSLVSAIDHRVVAYNVTPPAMTTTPQVQRLLAAQSGAVVVNRGQARRELRHVHHAVAAPQVATVPPRMEHGRGHERHVAAPSRVVAPPVVMQPQVHGRGHGHGNGHGGPPIVMAPAAAPPQAAGPPAGGPPGQQKQHENGNGKGKGKH